MVSSRRPTALTIPLLALPLSCTGGNADDEGEGETGDGDAGACADPGTPVDGFDPFVPPPGAPQPACSTGWGSDVPLQDPKWVTMIPSPESYYYYTTPPVVKALANNAALLIRDQTLQWFDGQGVAGAEVEHGFQAGFQGIRPGAVVVREADDHVFIAGSVDEDDLAIREFADGAMVGEVVVPTPGVGSRAIGLFEFSTDDWLIVGDEFDPLEYTSEAFFMHVDANGAEILRKARPLGYGYYYNPSVTIAAFDQDNLLFGSNNQQFIVDPTNGAVLNPGVGLAGSRFVIGSIVGAGFVSVSQQNNNSSVDGVVTRIDGLGATQWTQTYDRALSGELFFDVDARVDGGFVAAGVDGIWWDSQQFQSASQPMIIAFDGQGAAEWIGRLAIPGFTRSVDAAPDGGIAAAGDARLGGSNYDDIDSYVWLGVW